MLIPLSQRSIKRNLSKRETIAIRMAPTFLGGKLKLKGKKKKKKSKHSLKSKKSTEDAAAVDSSEDKPLQTNIDSDEDDGLTAAERRSLKLKKERETMDIEKLAKKSHRERVEEFNEKIGNLTELNDIPRVSIFYFYSLLRSNHICSN